MVLYNQNYEMIAISRDTLSMFGFSDPTLFFKTHSDISEFFAKHICVYDKNRHFIDFICNNPKYNIQNMVFKLQNGDILNAYMDIEIVYPKDKTEYFYRVSITKTMLYEKNPTNPQNLNSDSIFNFTNSNTQNINEKPKQEHKVDSAWLWDTFSFVNLPKDKFAKLLYEFIKKAEYSYEKLYEAKLFNQIDVVNKAVKDLANCAYELKFSDFLKILINIQISCNDEDINEYFNKYKDFVKKLNEIAKKEIL